LRSPMSFFDTTPMGMFTLVNLDTFLTNIYVGRIMSRFSKDQDTLDTQISKTLYQVGSIFVLNLVISQYFGLVPLHIQFRYRNGKYLWYLTIQALHDLLGSSLSSISQHYFRTSVLYWIVSTYYRRTSVETKRLDSILRSILYGSYSGQLFHRPVPQRCWSNGIINRKIDRAFYYPCL
jgi:hypothetical protein